MSQDLMATTRVRRFWRSGGLLLESEYDLDDLATPVAGETHAHVRIVRANADVIAGYENGSSEALVVGDVARPWLVVRRADGAYLLRWPDQLDVVVPDDGNVILAHERGEIPDSIARLLLCQSLSFTLPAHGREGVHASAVEVAGRAVILAGSPGRGKSTLATALCLAGGRLLADDLTIVRLADGVPVAEPGSTKTWLLRGVADHIFGPGRGLETARVHKVAIGGDGLRSAEGPVPIAALYVLALGHDAPVVSEPLSGPQALFGFLNVVFNMVVSTPARSALLFAIATEVAAKAAVRTVRWQPGPEAARLMAERIIHEVAGELRNGGEGHMTSNIPAHGLAMPLAAYSRDDRHETRRQIIALLRDAGITDAIEDGMDEPLLRTSQVAALLRSSDRTVRAWADAGKLRYVKTLGGRRLFPASAVLSALKSMSAGTKEEE